MKACFFADFSFLGFLAYLCDKIATFWVFASACL